jgi:hypothetical protein
VGIIVTQEEEDTVPYYFIPMVVDMTIDSAMATSVQSRPELNIF